MKGTNTPAYGIKIKHEIVSLFYKRKGKIKR